LSLPGPTEVGVIIGRFQVPFLHAGHRKLFDTVLTRHKRVLVLLGIPAWRGGIKNPLDYKTREMMIRGMYPDVTVGFIQDRQKNEEWSEDVDKAIRSIYPLEKVTLYGGRNGFISFYTGSFPTVETLEDPAFDQESGTVLRGKTAALPRNSTDFRSGVIYASYGIPSSITMCVDAAILKHTSAQDKNIQVLLIRKPNETKWRFPGGRVDPGDASLGQAAVREAREETTVEVGNPTYIGSSGPIPDWRGEQSGIAIHSALFYMPYVFGAAVGSDDAAEARWCFVNMLTVDQMEPCHKTFLTMLKLWIMSKEGQALIHQ
jgi:bifunctional NMN adenylyltransferase/nudix hydrolase